MEIIEELERTQRGIYAGGVLYMDFAGNLDSCIALRTMVIKNGMAHVQAGGGVVADSTPIGEYKETLNKSRALLAALESAHQNKSGIVTKAGGAKKAGGSAGRNRGRRKLK
jgi:anthranilate synthase component 1